jgi:glycosyltransferase involved in cell wall biosynthesis
MSMRVCIVSQECPGVTEYFGGIGTQYGALASAWATAGIDTHFVTMKLRGQQAPAMLDGVHIHALGSGYFFPWHAARWARDVDRALADTGPYDAIISPEFRGECARYAGDQRHGPLVTHLLTSSQQLLSLRPGLTTLERHGPRTHLFLRLERLQAERSHALYAPSSAILTWARQLWPRIAEVPSRILPLAIRVGEVREQAARGELPPGFPPTANGPIIGLASRLDGHKGAEDLVEAMRQVWRAHSDARLVFIGRDARYGRGMMSDHLRSRVGGYADRLHITGA